MIEPTLPGPGCALFFDFDGTLVELAARPDEVKVPPTLPARLRELADRFDGALALVSGRPVSQIDQWLAPCVLPVAGVHGAERRDPDGRFWRIEVPGLDAAAARLQPLLQGDPRLMLERKPAALALHYRGADDRESDCIAAMEQAALDLPEMTLMRGKKVLELKPGSTNKGSALLAFLAQLPFAQRRPYFFGDDVTDEAGFDVVQALGGVAVKVGEGESVARHRLAGPAAVLQWIDKVLATDASAR
jgi:trehalose 6-phosphate phosphatase